jgi:anaerobic selenocysteine-containing dehydrogenase
MSAYNSKAFVHYSDAVVKPEDEVKDEWEMFNLLGENMQIPTLGDQPFDGLKSIFPNEDPNKFDKMRNSEKGIFLNEEKRAERFILLSDNINFPDKLIPLFSDDYLPELEKLRKWEVPHDKDYPFSLISGRQIETINSWIHARGDTNYCYLNTDDARRLGINDGQNTRISTKIGAIELPAKVTDDLMKGVVWIPHGWGRTSQDVPDMAVDKLGANVNLITDDDWTKLEPLGGMVMLDGIPVKIEKA